MFLPAIVYSGWYFKSYCTDVDLLLCFISTIITSFSKSLFIVYPFHINFLYSKTAFYPFFLIYISWGTSVVRLFWAFFRLFNSFKVVRFSNMFFFFFHLIILKLACLMRWTSLFIQRIEYASIIFKFITFF